MKLENQKDKSYKILVPKSEGLPRFWNRGAESPVEVGQDGVLSIVTYTKGRLGKSVFHQRAYLLGSMVSGVEEASQSLAKNWKGGPEAFTWVNLGWHFVKSIEPVQYLNRGNQAEGWAVVFAQVITY